MTEKSKKAEITFEILELLNENNLSKIEVLGILLVVVKTITENDKDTTELSTLITRLLLLKYDRMGVLKTYEKTKVKELI